MAVKRFDKTKPKSQKKTLRWLQNSDRRPDWPDVYPIFPDIVILKSSQDRRKCAGYSPQSLSSKKSIKLNTEKSVDAPWLHLH